MSVTASPYKAQKPKPASEVYKYRSLSKAAVACLVFGLLSLLAFLITPALIFPVISIACGLIALSNLKQFPDELLGLKAAKLGLLLGSISFVGAIGLNSYIYATEVPEGYDRISFRMLRVDSRTALPYSEQAEELNGQKVFVRGYVRPGVKRNGLTEFIMVGNFGACCYGGKEKPTDVIAVRIKTGETIDYSLRLRRIAGVFHLNKRAAKTRDKDVPRAYYQIEADYVR